MTSAAEEHAAFVQRRLAAIRRRLAAVVEATDAVQDGDLDLLSQLAREPHSSLERWPMSRLALSESEEALVWVLIAHEVCPWSRVQLRKLATEQEVDLSRDVLSRVVYGSELEARAWYELSPAGKLRAFHLIEQLSAPDAPAHRATYRISRRVLALAHGQMAIDDEIEHLLASDQAVALAGLIVNADTRRSVEEAVADSVPTTMLVGSAGMGRRSLAIAALRAAGHEPLALDARKLAHELDLATRQLRVFARECRLLQRRPVIVHADALIGTDRIPDRLALLDRDLGGPAFITTSHPLSRRWRTTPNIVEMQPLTGGERERLWQRCLPMASKADAELLATIYPLAPALVNAVGEATIAVAKGTSVVASHVGAALRSVLDDRLAGLAHRVTVTQSWEDLVLPEDQTLSVIELLARVRTRRRVYEDWGFGKKLGKGLGVTALFSGAPGTGKTMCAGLLAKDLGTELYQVDLSKIVSKWVGETEKNLASLFDAAEAGHAVILFDEADSLFGKRTSVSSSNDRYANQETNYLLQRLESFSGICILTTNHDPAIDEAFRRRLSVHIRFPVPEEEERARLWSALLPPDAPRGADIDLAPLARKYVMGGGYIRNAVLRAAFIAADADEPIGMRHLRHAAQVEYEAIGKLA